MHSCERCSKQARQIRELTAEIKNLKTHRDYLRKELTSLAGIITAIWRLISREKGGDHGKSAVGKLG